MFGLLLGEWFEEILFGIVVVLVVVWVVFLLCFENMVCGWIVEVFGVL